VSPRLRAAAAALLVRRAPSSARRLCPGLCGLAVTARGCGRRVVVAERSRLRATAVQVQSASRLPRRLRPSWPFRTVTMHESPCHCAAVQRTALALLRHRLIERSTVAARLNSVVRRWRPKRPLVPEAVTRPGAACPAASPTEAAVRRAWRRLGLLSDRCQRRQSRGAFRSWRPGWLARIADAKLVRSLSRKGCSPDNSAYGGC
jgi:hypothetical protein